MRPRSRFLIGFATAALTFGTFMATLGPQKFGAHCGHNRHHHGYAHHCYNSNDEPGHTVEKAK